MMKVRPVHKKRDDMIHATTGFGGTLCGQVEGFDWRVDEMLDVAELHRVECPSIQGTPRTRGYLA
jgi:hypothetical protein